MDLMRVMAGEAVMVGTAVKGNRSISRSSVTALIGGQPGAPCGTAGSRLVVATSWNHRELRLGMRLWVA